MTRPTDQPRHRSLHGLYRALINNMVVGVSAGYTIRQELVGVGYRVDVQGQLLILSLGFSHEVQIMLPAEIKAEAEPVKKGQNPVLCLKSADKRSSDTLLLRFAHSVSQSLIRVRVSSLSASSFVVRLVSQQVLNNRRTKLWH